MMTYFQHRRLIKYLRQLLREAQHARNLKEDVAEPKLLRRLDESRLAVRRVMESLEWPAMASAGQELENAIRQICPPRPHTALRENIEIILVAVAVAMAFRTYFIQPFKIPTGSMSPTLYGIHYTAKERPDIFDRLPFNLVKWLVWGEWYVEVRAKTSGNVRIEQVQDGRVMLINGVYHLVNRGMADHVAQGDYVVKGQLLASAIRITGDHIFVDKVSWNFRQPGRGEIMVFKTTGIHHPQIKPNEHYVKRMVGLPDETLQFQPPRLLVNGQHPAFCRSMARIESQEDGYDGYQLGGRDYQMRDYLAGVSNQVVLGQDQFFACGDNQFNSLDSRYWGPVERKNLVGPAKMIYWPISRRWGLAE